MNQLLKGKNKFFYLVLSLFFLSIWMIWSGLKINGTSSPALSKTTPIPQASSSASPAIEGPVVGVTQVIDGDTIEIEGGQKVRYIGIDTPETVDPRRPVACFGREAAEENKKLVEGKSVILVKDVSEIDKYGRLLRYVYLNMENGQVLFINDHLLRQGYARVSTYPPDVKFTNQFLEAEKESREKNLGLWGKCL